LFSFVIPGRIEDANPEPMNTGIDRDTLAPATIFGEVRVHGFRVCPRGASRNDMVEDHR
jgi:hypothetical protein